MGYAIIHPINMNNQPLHEHVGMVVCKHYYEKYLVRIKDFMIGPLSLVIVHEDESVEPREFRYYDLGIEFDKTGNKFRVFKSAPFA